MDVETLEELVVSLLKKQGKKLATAESCTGGLLAKRITDVSGSSAVFDMGCVTYANAAKEMLLSVSPETLEAHGAVSPETAKEMAEGIVRRSGSDLGIGITGIGRARGGHPGEARGAHLHRPLRRGAHLGDQTQPHRPHQEPGLAPPLRRQPGLGHGAPVPHRPAGGGGVLMEGPVTGRFAPTPSGRMHLGNLFCSLLAWLAAKKEGGRVVLRIEDLDQLRTSPVYAEQP